MAPVDPVRLDNRPRRRFKAPTAITVYSRTEAKNGRNELLRKRRASRRDVDEDEEDEEEAGKALDSKEVSRRGDDSPFPSPASPGSPGSPRPPGRRPDSPKSPNSPPSATPAPSAARFQTIYTPATHSAITQAPPVVSSASISVTLTKPSLVTTSTLQVSIPPMTLSTVQPSTTVARQNAPKAEVPIVTITSWIIVPTPSANRDRKGVNPNFLSATSTNIGITSNTQLNTAAAETAGGSSQRQPSLPPPGRPPFSPTGAKVLIAAGTVGGIILLAFLIFIALKCANIEVITKLKSRLSRKRGWENQQYNYENDMANSTFKDEKSAHYEESAERFNPVLLSKPIKTLAELERATQQHDAMVRGAFIADPPPVAAVTQRQSSQDRPEAIRDTFLSGSTMAYYGLQDPPETRGLPPLPAPRRPSLPRPNARMSDMSSMSSGFGDAQIDVPESGPSLPGALPQSRISLAYHMSRNRGGSVSPSNPGNRDTVYTTTSEDSAPRFRTVHSWVNQQSRGVMRQQESDGEIANMPGISDRVGNLSSISRPAATRPHQRKPSEPTIAAFRVHPGDEIVVSRGSRVPSVILDSKFGQ